MTQDLPSKVVLVLPFHFGHREQTVHVLLPIAVQSKPRCALILSNIAALKLSGTVHGQKPAGDVTKKSQGPPDYSCAKFAAAVGLRSQLSEDVTHQPSVVPFLLLNSLDLLAFLSERDRFPVTPVGVSGCLFAGVGQLQLGNQIGQIGIHLSRLSISGLDRGPPPLYKYSLE